MNARKETVMDQRHEETSRKVYAEPTLREHEQLTDVVEGGSSSSIGLVMMSPPKN
jgi:hypothetical protein